MSGYTAVNEAFRLAAKQNDLLKEALQQQSQQSSNEERGADRDEATDSTLKHER